MSRDTSPDTGRVSYARPPRPADYKLPVGTNARPAGKGWLLVDYSWNEKTGLARLTYRRQWNPTERRIVEVAQPANEYQESWRQRPAIDHDAVLGRYFESQHIQARMHAQGVYGR